MAFSTYLLFSIFFVVFTTPHYSYCEAVRTGKSFPYSADEYPYYQWVNMKDPCPSEGFFAHPTDCTQLHRCVTYYDPQGYSGYTIHPLKCPSGTAWNKKFNACDFIYKVASCGGQKPYECTSNGFSVDPTDCRMLYDCKELWSAPGNFLSRVDECPPGAVWVQHPEIGYYFCGLISGVPDACGHKGYPLNSKKQPLIYPAFFV